MGHIKSKIISEANSEGSDRVRKGYEYSGDEFIICSNCDEPLVNIIVVGDDEPYYTRDKVSQYDDMSFKANCPLCGDESFIKKLHRKRIIIDAIPGLAMSDMRVDDEKQTTTISLIKINQK